jgi:serine/threonine-protein kinase
VKTCPVCGKEYPDNVKFCPVDGSTLRSKAPTADLVGQVVADRYHIIKKLGEGGMGAVYLGEHVKMGRKSAIKVMAPSMVHDPDAISRFNREAANASRISHPNVCQIYDFGETPDGIIYLAMEFIEGSSLSDLIDREGALPPLRSASILKQSADALAAAHELGIVHRDLKPDNIMIVQARDGSDVVKVVDFGIAKAVAGDETGQKVTKTGLVVGTPEYMSPEQLSGDKLDGRSDIYSLGLVLYRMLTGVLPFQADTAQEVMIKRLTDEPMPLAEARPDIEYPPKLQPVLDRALARAPAERYQNAADFGRDTVDAVAGLKPAAKADVARLSTAATQLMGSEEVQAMTRKQAVAKKAPPPTRAAAAAPTAPAKRFPLAAILGGVAAVAALGGVGYVAMGGRGAAAVPDTGAVRPESVVVATADADGDGVLDPNDRCPGTAPGARVDATGCVVTGTVPTDPNPPRDSDGDGVPDARDRCANTAAGTAVDASGCPRGDTPGNPPTAPSWADSLRAANDAFDADQFDEARRLGTAVFAAAGVPGGTKASAAILVATTYAAANDVDRTLQWYRNALRYATGSQRDRVEQAIRDLGGTP